MEDRVDDDSLRLHIIEDDVGKSSDHGSAIVGQNGGIHQRMPLQGEECCLDTPQEFQTQAESLLLVPSERIGDILPGGRQKMGLFSPWTQGSTS